LFSAWAVSPRQLAAYLLLCLVLPHLLQAAPPATDPPIPFPEVSALEPDVAEQINDARKHLADVLASASPDPAAQASAYGELGKIYQAYSLHEAAEACYRNAMRLAPEDAPWPHYLGILLEDAGRLDEAVEAYGRALQLVPRDVPALTYQAEALRQLGRQEPAESAAQRALAIDPTCTAAKALLGQMALDRRDFRTAATLLDEALAATPQANRLHYLLAMAWRGLGDPAKAGEHFAQAGSVGVRPADPWFDELASLRTGERVHMARGKTAFDAGRFADAAEQFRRALAARPESVEARLNLAAALGELGQRAEAASLLREALRLAPDQANAHYNLAVLLAAEGTPPATAEAGEHLSAALAVRPNDVDALRLRARLRRDGGRLEEALEDYTRAVELAPADETARVGQAETLVRLGRYRQARERLEEARRVLPQSGSVAFGLARLLAACPDLAVRDGSQALDLALALWQTRPAASHAETAAMALGELGKCDEAAQWQRRALEAAQKEGLTGRLADLSAALAAYEHGAPCRYGVPSP
jgi:tetratricopeptide (TPR) repeat protein